MATTKKAKVGLEVLLVKAELKGIPEKALLKSRNMVQVDMVWPRPSIARKSAMREAAFRHGVCDFTGEPWTKRAGLRLKKGVRLTQKLDAAAVVLHDSHTLTSNLWGAFGSAGRDLSGARLHPACRTIKALRP